MDELRKKAEQEKLARMQGIKLKNPETILSPKRNRIEEAMGGKFSNSQFPISNEDSMPNLRKRPEDALLKIENSTGRGYANFLRKFFLGAAVLVLMGIIAIGGEAIFGNLKNTKSPAPEATVQAVGKLIELPEGETPTVATISDLEPLKGQEFFSKAAIGDKVLIFDKAKEAILYRPSDDKIISKASLK
jgi:hypothetical protein